MLKRVLCVGAVMAIFASTAMATAWITNIDEAISGDTYNTTTYAKTPYLVGSMSSDGRYVGMTREYQLPDGRWFDGPCLFDTTTNTYKPLQIKSGHGAVRGVEAMADGTPLSFVAEGDHNLPSWRRDVIGGPSNAWGNVGSYTGVPGNANAMGMDASGNGWMVGGTYNTDAAKAWKITNGVVATTDSFSYQRYPGKNVLNGVSVSGLAVGTWNDGSTDRVYITNVSGGTSGSGGRALAFSEFGTSNMGQGNAMSGNGLWAGGFFKVTANANGIHGFRNLVDATFTSNGVMEELLPVDFDPNLAGQQSNVFDIANDGTAVGFSWDPGFGGYQATLWAPGSGEGILVSDILTDLGVDMSEWQKLERVISISDDGMTIAGRGVLASDGSYSAFVAMIPEPATLSLLALGGLALLRRRR